MGDYEKYALTNEDINTGIQDFFTQLLIESKRQKSRAKTLDDLSSTTPTISYLVGQPGAGKTSLGKYIQNQYEKKGECAVEVSSDKIATYHRDYNELLKLLPDECYTISRQFVRPAEPRIFQELRNRKINILKEASFNKGEKDYQSIKEFKDSGYKVQVNLIAVDKYESFLSCIERDIKLLGLGYDPRPVARINHDRMYDPFIQEIIEMNKRNLLDEVNVFIRGKALNQPSLVYSTDSNNYGSPQEAVLYERAKARKAVLSEPQKYLCRIDCVRKNIEAMIQDEKMKNNYLRELNQLEREFLNELAFDRNLD